MEKKTEGRWKEGKNEKKGVEWEMEGLKEKRRDGRQIIKGRERKGGKGELEKEKRRKRRKKEKIKYK